MEFGKVSVTMSAEEALRIKALIDKADAKAVIEVKGITDKGEHFSFYRCPVCESVVLESHKFCGHCGQRVDTENIAF